MCGRFTHMYTWKELHRLLSLNSVPVGEELFRYNVAPTHSVPVVRQNGDGERHVSQLRWGLVPFWAKDLSIGSRLINARSEEAAGKPAVRAALKSRRCIVPMSGFYEWQAIEGSKVKQPWYFGVTGAPLFGVAGLWESWGKDEGRVETFTVLTGSANEIVAPVHNRMPVIVRPELYAAWLDPRSGPDDLAPVYRPLEAGAMTAHRVSTRVNSPRNSDSSLVECL